VVRFGVAFGSAFVVASVIVVPLFPVQGGSEFCRSSSPRQWR